ncbi:MAG TPA: hypothetical protein VFS92_01770 [Planctomycetota bacterium]|nr:hypothetical protein [Planctomycetota bacterium]
MARRLLAAAALAAALLPAPAASSSDGFLGRAGLFPVPFSGQFEATGGVTAWFRLRGDKSSIQGMRVWVKDLLDEDGLPIEEGATLWMTKPGEFETQEVASLACTEDGSGYFEVVIDSRVDDGSVIPLEQESMLKFLRATIEIRIPSALGEDVPALRGSITSFRYRDIVLGEGAPGTRSRTARLIQPPDPAIPPDDFAAGRARLWRRRAPLGPRMGVAVLARGLEPDLDYEVLVEDPAGDLQPVGLLTSTLEGVGYWAIEIEPGDTLPPEFAEDDVRGLARRRVEVRRSGSTDPSLVGILPRLR